MNKYSDRKLPPRYLRYIEITFWIGIVGIPLLAWLLPMSPAERQQLMILTLGTAVYIAILFHGLSPKFNQRTWFIYLVSISAIIIIALVSRLLLPYHIHTELLLVAVIASSGVIAGKKMAIQITLIAIGIHMVISNIFQISTADEWVALSLDILIFSLVGYVLSTNSGAIHDRVLEADRQNRYMSTLLQAGILASHRQDLRETLGQMAKRIAKDIPVTVCHISLLNNDGTQLHEFGVYPLRKVDHWVSQGLRSYRVLDFPLIVQALESGQPVNVYQDYQIETMLNQDQILFDIFQEVQTICILPLITQGEQLGIIAVGEARNWKREPFDQSKIDLLKTLSNQISATIYNNQLYRRARQQATRLAMLNDIAKVIGSTIELDDLLELIYQQVQRVLPAETYFVSLYDERESSLDLRVLIDNGTRYPPTKVPIKEGLSSWVLQNRRPLLIHHMTQDWDKLPVKPIKLGTNKISESWLGVPLLIGDELRGLLAIASYSPYAFQEDDVELLGSVAAQAALAIDNARHHAEVKEQARRDSLTNAYNHNHFLERLHAEVAKSGQSSEPVALIMLDIDFFKAYNDSYGHLIGDQVLVALVEIIQQNIRPNDLIGRWGGEEFGVLLPDCDVDNALAIAERIRTSLAQVNLRDLQGKLVPSPTVSQGIACHPQHAQQPMQLVDIADRALYQAKGLGRDYIIVTGE